MDYKEEQKRIFRDNIHELEKNIEQLKRFAKQKEEYRNIVDEIAMNAMKNAKILSLFEED
ncbi:hypothetical protein EAL2_c12870 [Peptoclostridium acidaminophilum DSM 3953]|uniref:Uncharacterized protein n=1 Tax=Peptoclostridium acidaminophilum DSM 3953 TaxID=1286171 RepID=W8TK55_PEPAC|nr:hypothetical protein [Peptoclostridium acidaminophilum]AHM56582.1 hypothetical protein EAL2_c12870 [Peptoclostridium acidaminophilum DSM 3953]